MFLVRKGEKMTSNMLTWMLLVGLTIDVCTGRPQLLNTAQNQPQLFLLNVGQQVPQNIPLQTQHSLATAVGANHTNLVPTSQVGPQFLIPTNTHFQRPVIAPVSNTNFVFRHPIHHGPTLRQVFVPTNTHRQVLLHQNPTIFHSPLIPQAQIPTQSVSVAPAAAVPKALNSNVPSQPVGQTVLNPVPVETSSQSITTPISDVTVSPVSITSVESTATSTTESVDIDSQVVSTTNAPTVVTDAISTVPTVAKLPDVISQDGLPQSRIQQTFVPNSQFSARTGLQSDLELTQIPSSHEQEETTVVVLEETGTEEESLKVMPSAEEVTARRFATMARSRSSPDTSSPTTSSQTESSTTAKTIPTSTTEIPTAATVTTARATITTSTPSSHAVIIVPNPDNPTSLATVFQAVSRAAVRDVAKLAAFAQSQGIQGLNVIPVPSGEGSQVREEINEVQ